MEFMPRITRAHNPMDVLASQSNLAGYKAVLVAANTYGRVSMTAAGTVQAGTFIKMRCGLR
jgi:NAD(P) transhydrogenase subunit alpha